MIIPHLIVPGFSLDLSISGQTDETEALLRALPTAVDDAAVALNLFLPALQAMQTRDHRAEMTLTRALESEARVRIGAGASYYDGDMFPPRSVQVEMLAIRSERKLWPASYRQREAIMHARSFLYALDSVDKILELLKGQPLAPDGLNDIQDAWQRAFPNLRDVRNSAHHQEDRVRGRGRRNAVLNLPSGDDTPFRTNGQVLIVEALNNDHYGHTMEDGHYGEVEVSEAALAVVVGIVQRIIDSYIWPANAMRIMFPL
jgi:hypothetical protein